jgi:1,4-dihydroxy-2-naphthoate octaprenyltransferase
MLSGMRALIRPSLLAFVAPPVLSALALLLVHQAEVVWSVAVFTLLASLFAVAGAGALIAGRRLSADGESPDANAERQRFAQRLGATLLALGAMCAFPVALTGSAATWLVGALGVGVIAFSVTDALRERIAPLNEILASASLGPGLVALTLVAQGQRMNAQDWLVALAIGCMALAALVARRLREVGATDPMGASARRTLVTLLGPRRATILTGVALFASYALALGIAIPKTGASGALLTLTSLPIALVGLSGLAISEYDPARRTAASLLARAYAWFGLALALGLTLTVIAQGITAAIVQALGG